MAAAPKIAWFCSQCAGIRDHSLFVVRNGYGAKVVNRVRCRECGTEENGPL